MIEAQPGGSWAPLALAASLFVVSGVGALVVQTLWLRELRLSLGGASATFSTLMIGQAGGARLGERVAGRAANPLRAFGGLALAGALGALATPQLLGVATALLDAHYEALLAAPTLLALARGAAGLGATLPASLALGALAPSLLAATLGGVRTLGGTGVGLTALNALGGAAGAALTALVLVERVGLTGSRALGAALLAATGAIALAASLRLGRVPPLALEPSPETERAGRGSRVPLPRWLLQLAALAGFGSLAAQGLFARALGRVSNQSADATASLHAIALACVGLGALFIYSLSRRARPLLALGVALAVTGGACLVFPAAFFAATGGLSVLSVDAPWPAYAWLFVALAVTTLAPVLLPAACVLPSLLAASAVVAPRDGRSLAMVTGRLLAWNALGALGGSLLAPLVLIPRFGLWGAVGFVGVVYLLGSLGPIARAASPRFAVYAAILGAAVFVVVRPGAQPPLRTPVGERIVAIEETAAGLIAVLETTDGLALQLDDRVLRGSARERVRRERQEQLPLLLHPRPRRVLFLGSSTGAGASAALAQGVEAITLVESVPGAARAARAWFRGENHGVYDDPRTRVVADDVRSFLRASPEKFDVIVGDSPVPWQASTGGLYAVGHFENARARLAAGGVFCQWPTLDRLTREEFLVIARSFARAFPAGEVFRGDFSGAHPLVALCGRASGAGGDPRLAARALPGAADRWIAHVAGVRALRVGRIDAAWLAEGPVETNAAPAIEFSATRAHSGRLATPFTGIAWAELAARIATREDSRAGSSLEAASALQDANRPEDAAALAGEAARLLPPELIRDAAQGRTAKELGPRQSD